MARRLFALILSLLVIAAPLYTAKAVETPYTYKVTVYAGNQGSFSGASPSEYVIQNIGYDKAVILDWNDMGLSLKDSGKYYVRGFKLAGHDNDELLAAGSFQVTEDTALVISYGIRDDGMVNYTVRFLEEGTNKELASEKTYVGRVGDKPIVSHMFIENYLPNALNITGTLTSNEADNVFTFRYHKVDYNSTVYETLYGPGTSTGGGGATPSGGGTPSGSGEEQPTPSGGGEELPPEIIDDDNPPLAPGGDDTTPGNPDQNENGSNHALLYTAGALGVVALAVGAILLARKKRDEDEDEDEDDEE